jgi:hypothetical protein
MARPPSATGKKTATVGGADAKPRIDAATTTAYAGATAFLLAAAWYALVMAEVVVSAESHPQPGQSREEWLQTYFGWFTTTLAHERLYGGAAIIGFLCLLATAAFIRDRLEADRPLGQLGAQAVAAGAIIWVVGNVAALGGHHAVSVMTGRGDPLETVRLILWLIDDVDDAFELVGLAVIGIGLLALAWPPTSPTFRRVAWSRFTALVGLVLLAAAIAYAAREFDLVDLLLVVGGLVLLPAWLVWTSRLLRERRVEPAA